MDEITCSQARQLARDIITGTLPRDFRQSLEVLDSRFLVAENCWFFFRNRAIQVPEDQWFEKTYSACVVSRRGDARLIADLSSDPARLAENLNIMSQYFAHKEVGGAKPELPTWMEKL